MNKTAAIRSQARRAVLVKAAIDPTQIAGALAMAGGGALGGSAVTGDDQSMLKRIGKGTLGAALGYGGYKLMTDPRWQQGLRNGVVTARSLIAGLLGKAQGAAKAAEAQPTPEEQAFAAGFCKAAEAMGVDPAALAKAAAAAESKASAKPAAKSPSSDVVHGIGNSRLERMGVVTAPAVTALLGSLLGGRGAGRRLAGGVAGLGTGLLGNLGGSGLAFLTPTRSGEAQLKHDSALHVLKNLLLPGVGTYNKAKRLEREQVHKWYN